VHSEELQSLRAESNATLEQLRTANQTAVDALKTEHDCALQEQTNALQKIIDDRSLELKATQDDLAKAKAALGSAQSEVENLKSELDELRAAAEAAPAASPEHLAEIDRLKAALSSTKDDLEAITEMHNMTKSSLDDMTANHSKELEEAAKGRADEATKLRAAHAEEVATLATQKSELTRKLTDLEGELAILKASITAEQPAPKSDGNGIAHPLSPGVTREELQQMHEAHNLKMGDLQAQHDQEMKALREELAVAVSKANELQQDVGRKALEIHMLEQSQEDSHDQITRYVRFFGLKSVIGGVIALGAMIGLV
jgi:chromosome segregation ATPase